MFLTVFGLPIVACCSFLCSCIRVVILDALMRMRCILLRRTRAFCSSAYVSLTSHAGCLRRPMGRRMQGCRFQQGLHACCSVTGTATGSRSSTRSTSSATTTTAAATVFVRGHVLAAAGSFTVGRCRTPPRWPRISHFCSCDLCRRLALNPFGSRDPSDSHLCQSTASNDYKNERV